MDAAAFRVTRKRLGFTQRSFCATFGIARRTVQNWEAKGPPEYIGHLLSQALMAKIPSPVPIAPPPQSRQVSSDEALAKLSPAFDALLKSAEEAGWSRETVRAAMAAWAI
ncbi:helix-turn-helix domain-containing protein [Bosea massiliensis]|uniref:Helix-turn-helix domain-containing protein n=1 Tax=Bosea massiliensis TaxID=151419 RepID=A0ABW0P6L6_9HYPH